jgi:glycosyltransferase involved in cell wall biosynthesis
MTQMRHGGAERVCWLWLKNYNRALYQVTLVLFTARGEYIERLPDDVVVVELKSSSLIARIIELRKLINKNGPSAVISYLYYTNLVCCLSLSFMRKAPKLIISERNNFPDYLNEARFKFIKKNAIRYLYPLADKCVAISNGVGSSLSTINIKDLHVVYNPIDLALVDSELGCLGSGTKSGAGVSFVCMARYSPQKNHQMIVDAVAELVKMGVDGFHVNCFGEGEELDRLIFSVKGKKIAGYISFNKFTDNPYAEIYAADVALLASNYEGFGNAIIDAFACGVPVISTDCPSGPNEIIKDGQNGYLVGVGDYVAMALRMNELISNSDLRYKLAKNAKETTKQFSVETFISAWDEVLIDV